MSALSDRSGSVSSFAAFEDDHDCEGDSAQSSGIKLEGGIKRGGLVESERTNGEGKEEDNEAGRVVQSSSSNGDEASSEGNPLSGRICKPSTPLNDDQFASWLRAEFEKECPSNFAYGDYVRNDAVYAVVRWRQRFRGNPSLWHRLFKKDKVVKELIEAAPIVDAVRTLVNSRCALGGDNGSCGQGVQQMEKFTIVDLASGKGYLSMTLSELLPPSGVEQIILVDKAWPMFHQEGGPRPHQMNWDHIYGDRPGVAASVSDADTDTNTTTTGDRGDRGTYFNMWPIALHTCKQDLKKSRSKRQLANAVLDRQQLDNKSKGPVVVLAVHLCGTLSLRAVDFFNDHPDRISFLALKPCCLPGLVHARRREVFRLGRHHSFPAEDVCAPGGFQKKVWRGGPPRSHLKRRFDAWVDHLLCGVDVDAYDVDVGDEGVEGVDDGKYGKNPFGASSFAQTMEAGEGKTGESASSWQQNAMEKNVGSCVTEGGRKEKHEVSVQIKGGFQNAYIFAERPPLTGHMWRGLSKKSQNSVEDLQHCLTCSEIGL